MSKTRDKGIIAYGTPEDREKLAALADLHGLSGSELIIKMIRERFDVMFETDATQVKKNIRI